jgi:putative polyhydroxyalkanoate system protein
MPDVHIKQPHSLGLAKAKKIAEEMADQLGKEYGLAGTWSGNSVKFARPGVDGVLSVTDTEVELQVTLGFLMKMMKAPIEKQVTANMAKLFAGKAAAPKEVAKPEAAKPAAKTAAKSASKTATKTATKTAAAGATKKK